MKKEISNNNSMQTEEVNRLFPVFLKAEELNILICGGGPVALEKLQALIKNSPSARIKIISIEFLDEIKLLAQKNINISLYEKPYSEDDLLDMNIVICAVNNIEKSKEIRRDAHKRNILVNVADTPDLCDFYLSSVVTKGNLKIAISTNGKSPTIAKRLKEMFQETLPEQLSELLLKMPAIRKSIQGDFTDKVNQLNQLTSLLINKKQPKDNRWQKIATYSLFVFAIMLIGHFIFSYIPLKAIGQNITILAGGFDTSFKWMFLAGFLAQLVDGALGMGYGLVSISVLLSTGISPVAISGSIHTAEIFASGASGYSHYKFGNVNKKLFKALVIPGVIGAVFGALLLYVLDGQGEKSSQTVRAILAIYTLFLGIKILLNAFKSQLEKKRFKHYSILAGSGGFLDSFGGGGWGPLVTSTLINKGRTPRYVIGTVSITEFFVTLSSAFTFFILLGVSHWQTILGLILGGLIAAPIAARLVGKIPQKTSFILIGLLVIIWSIRLILKFF